MWCSNREINYRESPVYGVSYRENLCSIVRDQFPNCSYFEEKTIKIPWYKRFFK